MLIVVQIKNYFVEKLFLLKIQIKTLIVLQIENHFESEIFFPLKIQLNIQWIL